MLPSRKPIDGLESGLVQTVVDNMALGRALVAGLDIPENRLALIHSLLRDALKPVRAFDTREAATLEPAPTFDAAAERDRHVRR